MTLTSFSDDAATDNQDHFAQQRATMVARQLQARGIVDTAVLAAMNSIPREKFVPADHQSEAYRDGPLPIGYGQTISQPYTVAMMCEALLLTGTEKVLEIGTGSGYAACVLSKLAKEVHTIELISELAAKAKVRIQDMGISNVQVYTGDGSVGLREQAPFAAIVVAAGGPSLPSALADQLADGGRLVMPIGPMRAQTMFRYTRKHGRLELEQLGAFSFVPLIGEQAWSGPAEFDE